MNDIIPSAQFSCTQCGGDLHPDEGQMFITCPFCSSTVYIDKAQVVFHWYLAPTLDEAKARTALARWMGGNDTVKDLDRKSIIRQVTFEFFPLWHFKHLDAKGNEVIHLQPAAATSVSEIRHMPLLAGDLRKYDPDLDSQAAEPNVPLEAAAGWLNTEYGVVKANIIETSLVHVPVFTIKYEFQGRVYTALIEAATGRVIANIFPEKAEAPYLTIGIITGAVFLCLAVIPLVGAVLGEGGSLLGLGICIGLGIPIGAILTAAAAGVAAKV